MISTDFIDVSFGTTVGFNSSRRIRAKIMQDCCYASKPAWLKDGKSGLSTFAPDEQKDSDLRLRPLYSDFQSKRAGISCDLCPGGHRRPGVILAPSNGRSDRQYAHSDSETPDG